MNSQYSKPLNIGSSESVSIQELYDITAEISGVNNVKYYFELDAPQGVRGRSSDNSICFSELGWTPSITLKYGMLKTYAWVLSQIESSNEKLS
jgi:nucleoside-diphosphate-sugar epimerase